MATQNQQKAEIEYLQQEIAKMEKQLGPDSTASFAERLAAGAQLPQLREELEAIRAGRIVDPELSEPRRARVVGARGQRVGSQSPERQEPKRKEKSVLRGERSLADYFGFPDPVQFDRFMRAVVDTVFPGLEKGSTGARKAAEKAEPSPENIKTFLETLAQKQAVALGDTEYEAFRSPDAPQEPPIGDTSRSSNVDDLDESAGSRPLSPKIDRKPSTSVSPLMGDPSVDTLVPEVARSGNVGAVTTAPAAPKKQVTDPPEPQRRLELMEGTRQSIDDVRPISRPSDVEDLDESAASMESQMDSLMGVAEEQPGGVTDVSTEPTAKTQRMRDEEIAAREPFGESAGRLAIQNFMECNIGFTSTVTYDDDSDPDLNP